MDPHSVRGEKAPERLAGCFAHENQRLQTKNEGVFLARQLSFYSSRATIVSLRDCITTSLQAGKLRSGDSTPRFNFHMLCIVDTDPGGYDASSNP